MDNYSVINYRLNSRIQKSIQTVYNEQAEGVCLSTNSQKKKCIAESRLAMWKQKLTYYIILFHQNQWFCVSVCM